MKTDLAWILCLCLCLVGTPLACQRWPDAPRLEVEPEEHDFGRIYADEEVQHSYRLRNTGRQELVIDRVRTSCGCAVVELSAERLAPGEEAHLLLKVAAREEDDGLLEKVARIYSNDPAGPERHLRFTAEVVPAYQLDPPLLDLGLVRRGETVVREVRVADAAGGSLTAREAVSPDAALAVEVLAPDAAGRSGLRVSFTPRRAGSFLRQVELVTDHPRQPRARVTVQATVASRFALEPSERLDFGEISRGAGASRRVKVSSAGSGAPALESVTLSTSLNSDEHPQQVRATLLPAGSGDYREIEVEVMPHARGHALVGRLDIHTGDPDEPVRSLTLMGLFRD